MDIVSIARSVTDFLSVHNAELNFAPDFELPKIAEKRIVVVPVGMESKRLARSLACDNVYKIEAGILLRAKDPDVESLIAFSEEIGFSFLGQKFGNAQCISVAWEPIYSADDLRMKNQFTSVIVLHFKELT